MEKKKRAADINVARLISGWINMSAHINTLYIKLVEKWENKMNEKLEF